ncbi:uncharacterized protein ACBT57_005065 isoform 1-T3 [Dama dama]|uniref:uncharacterized protein LOC133048510 isoform X1 n=1 Tax=Dama dama TaxID=30532 RepID=UPI002A368404|nr:uncharacterized protein LOC133048510 isoform X1 [Dama dama]
MEPHRWGASGGGQRVRRSPSSRAATAQFLEPVPCAWHSSRLWDTAANQRSRYPSLVMVSDNKQAPWNAARQASLSLTISWSLPKFISIELVMPSNHLILCCPLLLLPSVFPSIRVFSSELALHTRWPKYWSFSFSISSSNAQNSGKLESRDGRDPLRANIAVCYNGLVKTRTSDDAAIQQWLEIEDPKACQKRNRIPKSLCKSRSSVYCFHIFGDISETLS